MEYIPAKLYLDSGLMSPLPSSRLQSSAGWAPAPELPSLDQGDGVAASQRQHFNSHNPILIQKPFSTLEKEDVIVHK